MSYKAHMHGHGESHSGVVPTKGSNAGQGGPKEIVEGRPLTKENAEEPNPYWMPSQESGPSGLDRVRQAAQTWRLTGFYVGLFSTTDWTGGVLLQVAGLTCDQKHSQAYGCI